MSIGERLVPDNFHFVAMAKYLSTVFRLFVTKKHQPVFAIPNSVHVLLSKRHVSGSYPEQSYENTDADGCDDEHNRQRLLKVAVIGVPNAGKSSLINSIVQRSVRCPFVIIDSFPLYTFYSGLYRSCFPDMSVFV